MILASNDNGIELMKLEHLKTRKAVSSCLVFMGLMSFTITSARSSNRDPVVFTERTVIHIILGTEPAQMLTFSSAEERQKLCYYAKLKTSLPYIDYKIIPYWRKPILASDQLYYHAGMYCATLPTMYMLALRDEPVVQITFIRSKVNHYKFDKDILEADFIYSKDMSSDEVIVDPLAELDMEDRRNLCVEAEKLVPVHFIHHSVLKVRPFKFTFENRREIHNAIACPSTPQMYLYRGNSEKTLKIAIQKSLIDNFKFQMDEIQPIFITPIPNRNINYNNLTKLNPIERVHLCIIARKHCASSICVPYVEDINVTEARLYSFEYIFQQNDEYNISVLCPAIPQIYLTSNKSSEEENRIRLRFLFTATSFYETIVEMIKSINWKPLNEHKALDKILMEKQDSLIISQGLEDRWNACFAAQKKVLDESRWKFRFTSSDRILSRNKILLIPTYVSTPRLSEVVHLNGESEINLTIQCSEWPQMHISFGENNDIGEIIIWLKSDDLEDDYLH